MSFEAYQKLQTAMVLDAHPAEALSRGDFGELAESLTAQERDRLVAQAIDPGLALTRKLHKGWRLTKLLTLLPMTFRVGDPDTLADLVDDFWHGNPQGLYFEAEALRFAGYVRDHVETDTLLFDVAGFEAAMLAVGERTDTDASSITTHATHDPRDWLLGGMSEAADGSFDVTVSAGMDGPDVQMSRCHGSCRATLPSATP